jgi:hypothetical protein
MEQGHRVDAARFGGRATSTPNAAQGVRALTSGRGTLPASYRRSEIWSYWVMFRNVRRAEACWRI